MNDKIKNENVLIKPLNAILDNNSDTEKNLFACGASDVCDTCQSICSIGAQ